MSFPPFLGTRYKGETMMHTTASQRNPQDAFQISLVTMMPMFSHLFPITYEEAASLHYFRNACILDIMLDDHILLPYNTYFQFAKHTCTHTKRMRSLHPPPYSLSSYSDSGAGSGLRPLRLRMSSTKVLVWDPAWSGSEPIISQWSKTH